MSRRSARKKGRETLVLLSGGIDSAACVDFYLEQQEKVRAMFVEYGQLAVTRERNAARRVASHFGIPLTKLVLRGTQQKTSGLIPARNAFLLFAGLGEFRGTSGFLAIGVHKGTPYYDCSTEFVANAQRVFDGYTGGSVQIGAPFLDWTKRDVWEYCQRRAVPVELTYSCERGEQQPCGRCDTCKDLEMLYAGT